MPGKQEDAERKNPVHQANYWRDHCKGEVRSEAAWKAGYGTFLVGKPPKNRETKEKPMRQSTSGRLTAGFDADIEVDLSNRFIQRHANIPQIFSHHVYPKLESYQVKLPERQLNYIVRDIHTDIAPKVSTWVPDPPRTENGKYGWLVGPFLAPTAQYASVRKIPRRKTDLAKAIGLPYEAW